MQRYKIQIEYNGKGFSGWQRQKDVTSIQEEIEKALFRLSGEVITVFGSGRTDAGVHAISQIAHFDLINNKLEDHNIVMGLNTYLSKTSISIVNCSKVNSNFHSRLDAKIKIYEYVIFNRPSKTQILKDFSWHVPQSLNIDYMIKASRLLIGTHDFSSFRDKECQAKSSIKTIDNILIEKELSIIKIRFYGKSFLHHMVRNIVGTLVLVGREKIEVEEIKKILEEKNRCKSGPNAPAKGLYLIEVRY